MMMMILFPSRRIRTTSLLTMDLEESTTTKLCQTNIPHHTLFIRHHIHHHIHHHYFWHKLAMWGLYETLNYCYTYKTLSYCTIWVCKGIPENGEGGIRTHEQSPVKRFRVVRFRPLSHLSVIKNI